MDEAYRKKAPVYDYGNMNLYRRFQGTHPKVMEEFVRRFDWADQLHFEKNYKPLREPIKQERLKNRILTWIEQNVLGGRQLMGYSNWNIIR
jgi:hypothetical protein